MTQTTLYVFSLLAAAGISSRASASSAAPDATARVGSPAPNFTLEDQAGTKVSLSDFSGKVVVLEWFNKDCPFVQRHYRAGTMANLASKYGNRNVAWLAINTTHNATKEDNKAWKAKYNVSYPILSDSSGEVGKMYGATTTPHMYIIDASGKLAYAGGIDDDPKGESADPTNYVSKALDEILSGKAVSIPESKPYGCSVKYAQ